MEGLRDRRALDANQALSEEEQRDDNVGNIIRWWRMALLELKCACLTASRPRLAPLQVCPGDGAD